MRKEEMSASCSARATRTLDEPPFETQEIVKATPPSMSIPDGAVTVLEPSVLTEGVFRL